MGVEETLAQARRPENVPDPGAYLAQSGLESCRWSVVSGVLRDPDYIPSVSGGGSPLWDMYDRWLIATHGERHERMRRRLTGLFGPRRMATFRPLVEQRVNDLITGALPEGRADLVTDLAQPLPFSVVCDVLGVPHADRPLLAEEHRQMHLGFARRDEASFRRADLAAERMQELFEGLLRTRELTPEDDLLTALVGRSRVAGEERADLVANCVLLVDAGHATTTTLIAGGIHLLLERPHDLAAVQEGRWPMPTVVQELVRLLTPIGVVNRRHPVSEKDTVYLLCAANRDPDVFQRPDDIDPHRDLRLHLAFSAGRHACLGAPLALLQAEVALQSILTRMPGLRHDGVVEWRSALPLHELEHLPVAWSTSATTP